MVTDKRKLKRKTYANNFKKKLEELKASDPKKYEKRVTKMKKSSNRSSRIYQRRMRVGKDPKKISARIRRIFKIIYVDESRAAVTENVVTTYKDLDEARKDFRGTVKEEFAQTANTIDLLVELVGMLKDNQIYFRHEYSKTISLKFRNETISLSWPKDWTHAISFPFHCILIRHKEIYHTFQTPIEVPQNLGYEVIPMRKVHPPCSYVNKLKFEKFLKIFGLSMEDLKN